MESFKVKDVSFAYPTGDEKALCNINFSVKQGEFVLICGKSGCGKTTLLRLLKPSLSPHGNMSGNIYFNGKLLADCNLREQASGIGFVMQSPDNQIVTDKVWHELSFGLESLGFSNSEIRTRVSEMASFFGIENWFYKKVTELSGGQKQLLNLASVMVMQPSVLILDEPTSQLDPIASGEFLNVLKRINTELGVSVILTEHRIEDAFPIADRVIVMDNGRITADDVPQEIGKILKEKNHDMYRALPTPMRVHSELSGDMPCPLTVRDGRMWLEEYVKSHTPNPDKIPTDIMTDTNDTAVEIREAWFRYEKDQPDVVKGFNLRVEKGELFAVVGGNGTGKTTALSLISGLNTPYRGEVLINGQSISKIRNPYDGLLGVLPQNPQTLFTKKTVYLDLLEIFEYTKIPKEEKDKRVRDIASLCRIEKLTDRHPYDLSGGEMQRVALAKVLLSEPQILLLDEPTKGMDAYFKEEFALILMNLKHSGVTVIMVSHDIEFCAEYADRCALFFDGGVTSQGTPREFFCGNSFYTTSANRMARTCLPNAVLPDDIILACGGNAREKKRLFADTHLPEPQKDPTPKTADKPKLSRIITGSIFASLFVMIMLSFLTDADILGIGRYGLIVAYALEFLCALGAFISFFPQRELGIDISVATHSKRKLSKRTLLSAFLILLLIPLTIFVGVYYLGDRKYYFISILIILEIMMPFCMIFESRKPQARELIVISVLCAIAVAGRGAFFMLPQFKPVVALVIISAVCLGGETGFLVGAVTGFVSNFFFGQGPWTPWQMFAFGIIGFISGILFRKGFLRRTRASLCLWGFFSCIVIYGGIVNPSSVITMQNKITWELLLASYITGFPLDLIHAFATVFFLWFVSEPMIDKIERVKVKYGILE